MAAAAAADGLNLTLDPWRMIMRKEVIEAIPLMATILFIFFAISFVWNLYILISYVLQPRLMKEPTNIFFFNLSLADFLLSPHILSNFIFFLRRGFALVDQGQGRVLLCGFQGVSIITLITATLHILALLSIDRFILMYRPIKYKNYFNWKKAWIIVLCIWIFSFGLSLPPLFGFGEYRYNGILQTCQPDWSNSLPRLDNLSHIDGVENVDFAIFLAVEALIPLSLFLLFNICTYRIICRSLRSRLKRQASYMASEKIQEAKRKHVNQQKQVIVMFTALLVINSINWTPVLLLLFVYLVQYPHPMIPFQAFQFGWVCYLLNPVCHPIMEMFFIKDLRDVVACRSKNSIWYKCRKKRKPVVTKQRLVKSLSMTALGRTKSQNIPLQVHRDALVLRPHMQRRRKLKRRWSYPLTDVCQYHNPFTLTDLSINLPPVPITNNNAFQNSKRFSQRRETHDVSFSPADYNGRGPGLFSGFRSDLSQTNILFEEETSDSEVSKQLCTPDDVKEGEAHFMLRHFATPEQARDRDSGFSSTDKQELLHGHTVVTVAVMESEAFRDDNVKGETGLDISMCVTLL